MHQPDETLLIFSDSDSDSESTASSKKRQNTVRQQTAEERELNRTLAIDKGKHIIT